MGKVRAKFRVVDPMNPKQLTLHDMRKMPYKLWLKYIEPHIIVMGNSANDCWCWDVKNREHDISKWVPQIQASLEPDAEHPVTRRWNVRRFIMQMFYDYPDDYVVYRNKGICNSFNCVRPSHMIIAPHGAKEAKYGNSG